LDACNPVIEALQTESAAVRSSGSIDTETLADLLDEHWMDTTDTGAGCLCGEWFFAIADTRPLAKLRDNFRPFSEHVAAVLRAKLQGETP
jgi:hypothetical protein